MEGSILEFREAPDLLLVCFKIRNISFKRWIQKNTAAIYVKECSACFPPGVV